MPSAIALDAKARQAEIVENALVHLEPGRFELKPLDVLMSLMANYFESGSRKDQEKPGSGREDLAIAMDLAKAAAPYFHPRLAPAQVPTPPSSENVTGVIVMPSPCTTVEEWQRRADEWVAAQAAKAVVPAAKLPTGPEPTQFSQAGGNRSMISIR